LFWWVRDGRKEGKVMKGGGLECIAIVDAGDSAGMEGHWYTIKKERIAIAIASIPSVLGVRIQNPTIQYIRVFVRKRELYL
jgi:hypothetical protein